jgi:hypothetical protein
VFPVKNFRAPRAAASAPPVCKKIPPENERHGTLR